MNTQNLAQLLLTGIAGLFAAKMLRTLRAPLRLPLDGLAADAPYWHAELTGRSDD